MSSSSGGTIVLLIILIIVICFFVYGVKRIKNTPVGFSICTTCPKYSTCQSLNASSRCAWCRPTSKGYTNTRYVSKSKWVTKTCNSGLGEGNFVPMAWGKKYGKQKSPNGGNQRIKYTKKYHIPTMGHTGHTDFACVPTFAKCKNCKKMNNEKWTQATTKSNKLKNNYNMNRYVAPPTPTPTPTPAAP